MSKALTLKAEMKHNPLLGLSSVFSAWQSLLCVFGVYGCGQTHNKLLLFAATRLGRPTRRFALFRPPQSKALNIKDSYGI